jgi:hypothetical protein
MNPVLLIVLGWLAVGLESGLKGMVALRVGSVVGAPSFIIPVVVMVAICAPPGPALWTALILGLLSDLTAIVPTTTNQTMYHIGPGAIGMVLGAQFVLLVRGMVIRRNPLTLVVLSVAAGIIATICTVAIITVRQFVWHDPIEWSATHELTQRLFSAVATGGSALAMSIFLLPLMPLLGLHHSHAHIRTRR